MSRPIRFWKEHIYAIHMLDRYKGKPMCGTKLTNRTLTTTIEEEMTCKLCTASLRKRKRIYGEGEHFEDELFIV